MATELAAHAKKRSFDAAKGPDGGAARMGPEVEIRAPTDMTPDTDEKMLPSKCNGSRLTRVAFFRASDVAVAGTGHR